MGRGKTGGKAVRGRRAGLGVVEGGGAHRAVVRSGCGCSCGGHIGAVIFAERPQRIVGVAPGALGLCSGGGWGFEVGGQVRVDKGLPTAAPLCACARDHAACTGACRPV